MMNEIETIVAAFSFGQLQDFLTINGALSDAGASLSDLEQYVNQKRAEIAGEIQAVRRTQEMMPDCPMCGTKMRLRHVCIPKGRQNLHGWKSAWECQSGVCAYEQYDALSIEQQLEKHGLIRR